MDFQQRLRRALEVKSVHQVLTGLESAIDGNLDRLEVAKTILEGSGLSVQTETPTPRTAEQIAVSENMRKVMLSVHNRKSHPQVRQWKRKRRLAKSRERFTSSIGVEDAIEDYERVPLLLPTVNRLPEARARFLESIEIAKTL